MSILQGDLSGESDCGTHNDLETDPFPCANRLVHGVEQAAANGTERAADEPENGHNADFCERETLCNGREGKRDDQRQHANTRADWVRVVDTLEVDWQVVEDDKVGSWKEDHEESARPYVALCELRDLASVLPRVAIDSPRARLTMRGTIVAYSF